MNSKIACSILAISTVIIATSGTASAQMSPDNPFRNSSEGTTRVSESNNQTNSQEVAQTITPGRATRSGPSYIGVGGNIGLGGDTSLGDGSFTVISKIGLTRNLSIRPSATIGDNTVILVPLTVDFPVASVVDADNFQVGAAPYIGGGAAISTGDNSRVGFLVSGGVDVPLSRQITANAGINVGFLDETEYGLTIGVGYNF
ncbi:hypothetical protein [Merismopedia glauca]|uniref:Outer membrane protein beta-barrel domain-containing protein n=1 Tax=Merismopedia glauca CCAP 1448/3 TaxID=1296344 RepID=A0A2T1C6H3_9CYAN|nr:hypothetical protein [Merismopedia glauca]PSB03758.1 hypothetical protein C7B64_07025 [Merismopedia glauca CCAP 1448/3]